MSTYCFLSAGTYLLLSKPALEQVKGIEPSSSAWKADIIAIIPYLLMEPQRIIETQALLFLGVVVAHDLPLSS